jgi:hypothetical protein
MGFPHKGKRGKSTSEADLLTESMGCGHGLEEKSGMEKVFLLYH